MLVNNKFFKIKKKEVFYNQLGDNYDEVNKDTLSLIKV